MSDPDTDIDVPPDPQAAEEWNKTLQSASTYDRIYRVALQLYEPTRVTEIKERADCSKNAARTHLKRLSDIGVLTQDTENPDTFSRNQSYFRWRRVNRLEQLSEQERRNRINALSEQDQKFQERYNAESPTDVDALNHAENTDVEAIWMELSEWETVRRRIRDLDRVRRRRASQEGIA
jgi:DNA-binding transcriptional regulator GbsR (MarR family)